MKRGSAKVVVYAMSSHLPLLDYNTKTNQRSLSYLLSFVVVLLVFLVRFFYLGRRPVHSLVSSGRRGNQVL
jgi:hypothetical protein